MLQELLTTQVCSDIIAHLRKRGWRVSKIARVMGASTEYVKRIQKREQSFQVGEVEALAKAYRKPPYRLIFDSFKPEQFEPGLYELGLEEIKRHEEFQRAMMRKPTRKRRTRTRAA